MAYQPYRGRKRHRGLRILLKILAAVLAVCVLGFLVFPNVFQITPEGLTIHFFWRQDEVRSDDNPPASSVSPSPSLQTASPSSSLPASPSSSAQREQISKIYALNLPVAALGDDTAADYYIGLVETTHINALVLDMKTEDGLLSYRSSLSAAQDAGAVADWADAAESAIARFKEENIYLIARISCFKDDLIPRKIHSSAIVTSNDILWLDTQYHAWLDPYSEESVTYISGVISELSALGFDEILLDHLTFPDNGRLSLINYGAQDEGGAGRITALSSFVDAVKQQNSDLRICAVMDYTTCTEGASLTTGQALSSLQYSLDRFIFSVPADQSMSAAYEACFTGLKSFLPTLDLETGVVPMIASPADSGADSAGEVLLNSIGTAGGQDGLGYILTNPQGRYPASGLSY